MLQSEVLLNLLTQAEHSTGRKEAAILSGPIVRPPGLGNQTALWPGCRLPLRPLLVGPWRGKEGGKQGAAFSWGLLCFPLRFNRIFSWLRASGSHFSSPRHFSREKESGRWEARAAPGEMELLKTASGLPPESAGHCKRH